MVVVPAATAVARPLLLFTVATEGLDEFHVLAAVKSEFVPSGNAAAAVNCWVSPTGRRGLTGATNMVP